MNEEYIQEPVTDVTENTEAQTVEQNEEGIELTDTTSNQEENKSVKTYTEDDLERIVNERVNELLPTKIEREKRKIEKTYRDKLSNYEETESILSAALKTQGISEINKQMRELYKEQGIDIPTYQKPKYSDDDERALGELEASKIIKLGFDEMQEEANRLATMGPNMSVRDKAMFTKIAKELNIQTIIHEQNLGYGANQKTCYNKALELGADIIVMLHPDFQYDPNLIPALSSMIAHDNYDCAIASRFLVNSAKHSKMPKYKYFAKCHGGDK